MTSHPLPNPSGNPITRRGFIHASTAASLALTLPHTSTAALRSLDKPVRIGVIADLHQDVMHDGVERVQAFVKKMQTVQPDALLQLEPSGSSIRGPSVHSTRQPFRGVMVTLVNAQHMGLSRQKSPLI